MSAAPATVWPRVIPSGWQEIRMPNGDKILVYRTDSGLCGTFSIEHWPGPDRNQCGPMEQTGVFKRIVLSRSTAYPTWDEMRDFIRECGLFDRTRDVIMVLPPDREYINVHPFAFHWWQRVTDWTS